MITLVLVMIMIEYFNSLNIIGKILFILLLLVEIRFFQYNLEFFEEQHH
jgi:hypothetical protein